MRLKERVLVAMSGGVDSSLAAYLLKKKGLDVIGATMKLWPPEQCGSDAAERACCSLKSIEDARRVAAALEMPHYVFDLHKEFKRDVIDYFCDEYAGGRTPNPCVLCNQRIKFDLLLTKARGLGCRYIATGHYAKVGYKKSTGRYYIREGKDKLKDQSYFLFSLSQDALKNTLLPLGGMTKPEARRRAKRLRLSIHDKKGSQEICFVPGRYSDYIAKERGDCGGQGDILDAGGKKIGRHKGIHRYTIGQRKGLGVSYKEALYVIGIDRQANTITVGPKKDVMKRAIVVKDVAWSAVKGISAPTQVKAKIRYGHKKARAVVERISGRKVKLHFHEAQEAPTPGQAAVFYKDDTVLGGGWIDYALE